MGSRPAAIFVGDAVGLDFLNSVATPVDVPIDWIEDGEGYLTWLDQARLVPRDSLQAVKRRASLGELDKVADQARLLREWFRGFVQAHKGQALTVEALAELEPLSRLLAHDEMFARIVARPNGERRPFALERVRRWQTPDSLLLPVGEALAQLVCNEDFSRIRRCQDPACTLLFADHSRGQGRRWCSMAICGNRAKQATHRDRLRQR